MSEFELFCKVKIAMLPLPSGRYRAIPVGNFRPEANPSGNAMITPPMTSRSTAKPLPLDPIEAARFRTLFLSSI